MISLLLISFFSGKNTWGVDVAEDDPNFVIAKFADSFFDKGVHRITFNADDLPAGIYIYSMEVMGIPVDRGKAILVK